MPTALPGRHGVTAADPNVSGKVNAGAGEIGAPVVAVAGSAGTVAGGIGVGIGAGAGAGAEEAAAEGAPSTWRVNWLASTRLPPTQNSTW